VVTSKKARFKYFGADLFVVLQYYTYTCDNASFDQSHPLRLKPCMDHWTKELKLSLSIRHQQQILDHLSDNTILQQLFPDPSSHRGYLKLLVLDATMCVCHHRGFFIALLALVLPSVCSLLFLCAARHSCACAVAFLIWAPGRTTCCFH